ncbi:MAG: nucleotidyl transferase AbiEii/AbiGii toxin family protein [Candidatus Dormibacteria bacterium]
MTVPGRVETPADLRDIAEELGRPPSEIEQDFLLVRIAAQLQADFRDQLCFKGGFILRHVYGTVRLSLDVDATRHQPAKNKLDSDAVGNSIRAAGKPFYRIPPLSPATNSKNSLDFDSVRFQGPISRGQVAVEVSYREAICLEPIPAQIGPPYIDAVTIPTMDPVEMLAEKYRTLCQRSRPTDLLDAALLWDGAAGAIASHQVAELIPVKFAGGIVRGGNHADRIRANIEGMAATYDAVIQARAPGAMEYQRAAQLVMSRIASVFRR